MPRPPRHSYALMTMLVMIVSSIAPPKAALESLSLPVYKSQSVAVIVWGAYTDPFAHDVIPLDLKIAARPVRSSSAYQLGINAIF